MRSCGARGGHGGLVLLLIVLAGCIVAGAQQQNQATDPTREGDTGYRLQVFADLLTLPTLVVDGRENSVADLRPDNFSLRIDSGPAFHPHNAHIEGASPQTLAIVLDASDPGQRIALHSLRAGNLALPDGLLHPEDRLVIYAFDCSLVGTSFITAATVRDFPQSLTQVLNSPALHADPGSSRCAKPLPLWDALALVGKHALGWGSWPALMVFSSGFDNGSRNHWETLRRFLAGHGIAVFGVEMWHEYPGRGLVRGWPGVPVSFRSLSVEDPFSLLCNGTGGLLTSSVGLNLPAQMQRVLNLLRDRYILEFTRPKNETPGQQEVSVTVDRPKVTVRISGVTSILRHTAGEGDVVPHSSTDDPMAGTRGILMPDRPAASGKPAAPAVGPASSPPQ